MITISIDFDEDRLVNMLARLLSREVVQPETQEETQEPKSEESKPKEKTPAYYLPKEAADLLNITETAVKDLCNAFELKAEIIKVGANASYRINPDSLNAYKILKQQEADRAQQESKKREKWPIKQMHQDKVRHHINTGKPFTLYDIAGDDGDQPKYIMALRRYVEKKVDHPWKFGEQDAGGRVPRKLYIPDTNHKAPEPKPEAPKDYVEITDRVGKVNKVPKKWIDNVDAFIKANRSFNLNEVCEVVKGRTADQNKRTAVSWWLQNREDIDTTREGNKSMVFIPRIKNGGVETIATPPAPQTKDPIKGAGGFRPEVRDPRDMLDRLADKEEREEQKAS